MPGPWGGRFAKLLNDKLAAECQLALKLRIYGTPIPRSRALGQVDPNIRPKKFGWFASKHKITFYTVNPFQTNAWPADARLMIKGTHDFLGEQIGRNSPVYERPPSESEQLMLQVTVELPTPTEEDFERDGYDWVTQTRRPSHHAFFKYILDGNTCHERR